MKIAKKSQTPNCIKISEEVSPIEREIVNEARRYTDRNEAITSLVTDLRSCRVVSEVVGFLCSLNEDLMSLTRGAPKNAFARQLSMYLAHTGFGMALTQVALGFQRDRSTITHAAKKIEDLRDDPEFDRLLDEVGELLVQILEIQQRFQDKISDPNFIKNNY